MTPVFLSLLFRYSSFLAILLLYFLIFIAYFASESTKSQFLATFGYECISA